MIYVIGAIVLFLIIFSIWYKSPGQRGKRGERSVALTLSRIKGYLYNDYYVTDEYGKSHQIDHILVCSKGIIVVETKNYSGRIYGNESQSEWTQVLQYGKVKNKLYNPVKQNTSHVYQIKRITDNKYKMVSMIIFVQGNIEHIDSNRVFTRKAACSFIQSLPELYDDSTQNEIIEILNKNRNTDISAKEHIANIKNTMKAIDNNVCPRCGRELVIRNGKNGQFYGCKGYPKCRFIKKL